MRRGLHSRDAAPQPLNLYYYQMGGTRMAADPHHGVVNSELRVHGLDNLFVASCSVFPTGGSSNPTLTLMQLTLRLAEQLRTSFA